MSGDGKPVTGAVVRVGFWNLQVEVWGRRHSVLVTNVEGQLRDYRVGEEVSVTWDGSEVTGVSKQRP